MQTGNIDIRIARLEDAKALLAIYAPYVENTAISFEYNVPTVEEFAQRIGRTLEKYPYLLAQQDGQILGYAYAGAFINRAAYSWSAESSIYIDSNCTKSGLGRLLYEALENVLREQNVLSLNACIASPVEDDEYVTQNSIQFHSHMGFRLVGEFQQSGYKFGRWYNMAWMEKHLAAHPAQPEPFLAFPQVRDVIKEKYQLV